MEQFNFSKAENSKILNALDTLIKEGQQYGLLLKDIQDKLQRLKSMLQEEVIRIVLLGSFSDGKTSTIAGLLGRLDDTMKIDQDESSDELTIYRPDGLKKGFEIVDTPGLFGTKEKEFNGTSIKYSDITKKYLSEAHIVIYVCDAVNPLKNSHIPVIKWIMRDLKKLDSTIFVINKMDEAGYDLTDEEDFTNGVKIKTENLTHRLRENINLTPEEESKLHIVCIVADPKAKGLQYWFSRPEDYFKRSRINKLRNELNSVIDGCDNSKLTNSAIMASIKDSLWNVNNELTRLHKPMKKAIDKAKESCMELSDEVEHLKSELSSKKGEMKKQIDSLRANLYAEIKDTSVETIQEVLDRRLGIENNKITGYKLKSDIEVILNCAQNSINKSLEDASISFKRNLDSQDDTLNEARKKFANLLQNPGFDNKFVLKVRDVFFKNFKFKPHGAVKMAKNINKVLNGIAVALELADWYSRWKAERNLKNLKEGILEQLDAIFKEIYDSFYKDDETYYKNFASSYIKMCEMLASRTKELEDMKQRINTLEKYKEKVSSFLNGDAEYVNYEEI